MMSGKIVRPRIDDTFNDVVRGLPVELQNGARELPYRLGLTAAGGTWEDFVVMDPNRDLPRYASENPSNPGACLVNPETLAAFRRAHHCAAIYGLIHDRIADSQVLADSTILGLRTSFLEEWRTSLCIATDSARLSRSCIGEALGELEVGNAREAIALESATTRGEGTLRATEYAMLVRAKLRWFGTAAHALLLSLGQTQRAMRLREAYDTFSMALQCMDDALDEPRDVKQRGMSFPRALGLSPAGLLGAVPGLVDRAAMLALEAEFHELGSWFTRVAATFRRLPIFGEPLEAGVAALVILAAVEDVYRA